MSQYPIPPLPTLSVALASIPIAPELMGPDGLPPTRRGSDPPTPSYRSQSSSARDDPKHWSYPPSHPLRTWDSAHSREQPFPPSDPDVSPKKRKRARNSLDDADGEHEFEHPSGDFKLGHVFVHPPKGSVQACERCHRIKRRCDGARPRCAGCAKTDVACVFELNAATSA